MTKQEMILALVKDFQKMFPETGRHVAASLHFKLVNLDDESIKTLFSQLKHDNQN